MSHTQRSFRAGFALAVVIAAGCAGPPAHDDDGGLDAATTADERTDALITTDNSNDVVTDSPRSLDASTDAVTDSPARHDGSTDATPDSPVRTDGAVDVMTGPVSCSGAAPSFRTVVHPILAGCSGGELCHGGLAMPWPYTSLVNVASTRDRCTGNVLVVPNNPNRSYLVRKLTGVGICPGSSRMPELGSPLSDADIQHVVDWICTGAPDN